MAKKHASDRKPYSPVDAAFMRSLPTVFASAPVEPQAHDVAVEVQQENIIAHAAPPTMEAEAILHMRCRCRQQSIEGRILRGGATAKNVKARTIDKLSQVSSVSC
jgi:hypothetical protein